MDWAVRFKLKVRVVYLGLNLEKAFESVLSARCSLTGPASAERLHDRRSLRSCNLAEKTLTTSFPIIAIEEIVIQFFKFIAEN